MDAFRSGSNVVSFSGPSEAPLDEQVGHLLRSAHKRASSLFSEGLNDHQLTPAQYFALARLLEVGQLSQNHLGRLTAMDPATIQGVIQRLRARGLVERGADNNDRRRKVLSLTASGRQIVGQLQALAAQANEAILAPLNGGEREVFLGLLKRLV
ncbi:MAG: MarR family winged helix-turn-helix transcriptional regulator [Rhodospirillales bacterium]|nr:MarR family winged helix-turn-helix transcriptional regulator [Rhodospirillales bacterium]